MDPAAKAAREEAQERFQRLFEAGPQPLGISDTTGRITALNPAYTRVFGYTVDDIPNDEVRGGS